MTALESKIEQILNDLYRIDASFKQHEAKVRAIIKEVLASKPDTKFDERFAQDLRRKLLAQADLLKEKNDLSLLKRLKNLKLMNYALGATALAAIILVVVIGLHQAPGPSGKNDVADLFTAAPQITRLPNNAFGTLAPATQISAPLGLGGDNGAETFSQNAADRSLAEPKAVGMGGGGGTSSAIMPPFVNYKYVYKGSEFSIDHDQMPVYRRVKTAANGGDIASLIRNMNFGLVDMSSFDDLKLENMNLVQNKDFGYSFNINVQESSISIYQNWQRWPTPDKLCQDQTCLDSARLKITDVPDDAALISIADQFLKDHNISTENYDTPYVDNTWKIEYDNATDKANAYIPNVLTVIYPQKIEGSVVYDESGRKAGLGVNVDVTVKKVAGLGELYAQNYDSSMYEVEKDSGKLIALAEKGGINGGYWTGSAGRTEEIELGTPSVVYVKNYRYSQMGISDELLIPSLMFPIVKGPVSGMFYQKSIIVPLPTDMQTHDEGPVRILPAQ